MRLVIRSLRILLGLGLALGGLIVILLGPNVSDVPFAALTLGAVVGCAVCWTLGVGLIFVAWGVAFGPAPSPSVGNYGGL